MTAPRRDPTPPKIDGAGDEISGQQIEHHSTPVVKPPAGLCWLACGASRCACCPLASEIAR